MNPNELRKTSVLLAAAERDGARARVDLHDGGEWIGVEGGLHGEIDFMRDPPRFRLDYPFVALDRQRRKIVVPVGFETDFASVPRVLWSILPPWAGYSPAAVVHDWLYRSGERSRAEADDLLRFHCEKLGVALWKRNVIYWAVRLFGGAYYTERRS